MVDRVLSELADQRGRLILVVDDLHELTSPDALVQLTRLLTNLPDDVHAVLATRRDLPLRLQQLRLAGELAEMRARMWSSSSPVASSSTDRAVTKTPRPVRRSRERWKARSWALQSGHHDPR